MPRPAIDLEPYKEYILELSNDRMSVKDIIKALEHDYEIKASERTVQSRMAAWQHRINQQTEDSSQLRHRIINLFTVCCLKDKDILEVLHHEGYQVAPRRLAQI